MGKTAFGYVGGYSGMYAFDRSNSQAWQTNVAWPAQNMPVEYFDAGQAWSLSVGSSVDAASVSVTLTRASDGRVWHFSSSAADGHFSVDNGGYGASGCIHLPPGDG